MVSHDLILVFNNHTTIPTGIIIFIKNIFRKLTAVSSRDTNLLESRNNINL